VVMTFIACINVMLLVLRLRQMELRNDGRPALIKAYGRHEGPPTDDSNALLTGSRVAT